MFTTRQPKILEKYAAFDQNANCIEYWQSTQFKSKPIAYETMLIRNWESSTSIILICINGNFNNVESVTTKQHNDDVRKIINNTTTNSTTFAGNRVMLDVRECLYSCVKLVDTSVGCTHIAMKNSNDIMKVSQTNTHYGSVLLCMCNTKREKTTTNTSTGKNNNELQWLLQLRKKLQDSAIFSFVAGVCLFSHFFVVSLTLSITDALPEVLIFSYLATFLQKKTN